MKSKTSFPAVAPVSLQQQTSAGCLLALITFGVLQLGVSQAVGQDHCLLSERFVTDDGGFTVLNSGNPVGPWFFDLVSWKANGTDNNGAPSHSRLNTPVVNVSQNGEVLLRFCHRYSFEGGLWDAGAVFVSLNGGSFVQVPGSAFIQNGYNAAGLIGNHDLKGGEGYNGDSPGYLAEEIIESIASLGVLSAGDTVQIQFLCAWDEFAKGSEPNWEIFGVAVGDCAASACASDLDTDGVPDDADQCPNSDLSSTVMVGGCDSGVSNDIGGFLVNDDGCSLADEVATLLANAASGARNHGQFVSRMARGLNALVRQGIITWAEHEALMSCVGASDESQF